MNIIDLIILIILLVAAILGFRQGLIDALSGVVALVIAIWLAWRNKLVVYIFLQERFGLVSNLTDKLGEVVPLLAYNPAVHPEYSNASAGTFWLDSGVPLPVTLFDASLIKFFDGMIPAEYIASKVVLVLSFLSIMILAYIAIRLLLALLNLVFQFGPLSMSNRLGGTALGLFKGLLLVWILLLLSSPLLEFASYQEAPWAETAAINIEQSIALQYLNQGSAMFMDWLSSR